MFPPIEPLPCNSAFPLEIQSLPSSRIITGRKMQRRNRCIRTAGPSQPNTIACQLGRFGNKLGTGLAISAQCGYNVRASGQYRNCLAINVFKYHRNVFPIPRVWQTYRTQNPVLARGCGFKSHLRHSHPSGSVIDTVTRHVDETSRRAKSRRFSAGDRLRRGWREDWRTRSAPPPPWIRSLETGRLAAPDPRRGWLS